MPAEVTVSMKKSRIVLIVSLLALIVVLVFYIKGRMDEKPVVVSEREQYMQKLLEEEE